MKLENGQICLSASDLMCFASCAHAAWLDLDNREFSRQLAEQWSIRGW